jgi:hypothetical protein
MPGWFLGPKPENAAVEREIILRAPAPPVFTIA